MQDTLLYMNLQLFAKDGPGGEKTEPATSKKLDDVRKEGQVAKSKEIITAVSLMALFIILKVYVGSLGTKLIDSFKTIYGLMEKVISDSSRGLTINMAASIVQQSFTIILNAVIPILIIAVIIVKITNIPKISQIPVEFIPQIVIPITDGTATTRRGTESALATPKSMTVNKG